MVYTRTRMDWHGSNGSSGYQCDQVINGHLLSGIINCYHKIQESSSTTTEFQGFQGLENHFFKFKGFQGSQILEQTPQMNSRMHRQA